MLDILTLFFLVVGVTSVALVILDYTLLHGRRAKIEAHL